MDTRLKNTDGNIKASKSKRIIRTVIIVLTAVMIATGILGLKDVGNNLYAFDKEEMYNDRFLGKEIRDFYQRVIDFAGLYKNEEYIKDLANITEREINYYKAQAERAMNEELNKAERDIYDSYSDEETINKKIDEKTSEIKAKYDFTDEEIRKNINSIKEKRYHSLKNSLDSSLNLKFIAYDIDNDIWMSNVDGELSKDVDALRDSSSYFKEYIISDNGVNSTSYINGEINSEDGSNYDSINVNINESYFGEEYADSIGMNIDNLKIYISVPQSISKGDEIYKIVTQYDLAVNRIKTEGFLCTIGIIGAAGLLLVLKKVKNKESYFEVIRDKIKNFNIDKNILIIVVGIVFTASLTTRYSQYNYQLDYIKYMLTPVNVVIWTLFILTMYVVGVNIFRSYKRNELLKDSHIVEFIDNCQVAMEKKSFGKRLFIVASMYFISSVIILLSLTGGFGEVGMAIAIILVLIASVMLLFFVVRDIAYLNKITNSARLIYEGKCSDDIPEKKKGPLTDLAHSINNMKDGLRKSIENETKSERMKTELITNVSHDLKTPLTSIINYVDLLKRVDVQPDEAKAYVEILDKKSQRLKILIEDLFEASKAASGSMQLNMEKLDIIALLNQTIGESEGRIEEAKLNFRLNLPNEKIYVNGDGRRLWRVFENLINNIIKYSLSGTRVYIDALEEDGKVKISMRNISVDELNFNVEEITDRFVRGEQSRHTEGSGLGLSIARSIVELHGGVLQISTDGDLFKVTVELETVNN